MNCTRCNNPLELNARFCRNCGLPVPAAPESKAAQPVQSNDAVTLLPDSWQRPAQPQYQSPQQQSWSPQQPAQSQWSQAQAQPTIPPGQFQQNFQNTADISSSPKKTRPARRRGRGCLITGLITLVVLIVLLVGGWFLALRPYFHQLASNQVDSMLTDAVNRIPSQASLLTGTYPVPDSIVNSAISSNVSSSDPVQNVSIHFSSSGLKVKFQALGFQCDVSALPQARNGTIVVDSSSITINGIAGLIFSPDELSTLLNKHLADVQNKLGHAITNIVWQDGVMILVWGGSSNPPNNFPPLNGTPTLPTLP